jgi:SAM-dependent methyltransferase
MEPQPNHLAPKYGRQFADPSVVHAYRLRPAYPAAAIEALLGLASGRDALLDVGCGRGNLTIPLAPHFGRVDGVDPSPGMLDAARELAGADATNVRWQQCTLSDSRLAGPYDLITAGESLHWTDWEADLSRLAEVLAPGARLAIVTRQYGEMPWTAANLALCRRYSTNRDYRAYDLVEELTSRRLFVVEGRIDTVPEPLTESADHYVEAQHSANGFSFDRMEPEAAAEFDAALRRLVPDPLTIPYWVRIEYGRPL